MPESVMIVDQVPASPAVPEQQLLIAVCRLARWTRAARSSSSRLTRASSPCCLARKIPVIVTSTDQRLLDRAQAEAARFGGQGFVVKPLNLNVLLESVRELIGTGGETREALSGA